MNFIDEQYPPSTELNSTPIPFVPININEYEKVLGLSAPVSVPEVKEIEDRLGLSKYYKMLLENGIFESRDPFSIKVESEVRQFIIGRLQELLGVRTQKHQQAITQNVFTEEEVEVLKALSKKLLDKPVSKFDTSEPQLKTVRAAVETSALKTNKPMKTKGGIVPSSEQNLNGANEGVVKKKEENEINLIDGIIPISTTHAVMSQDALAKQPKQPSMHEMTLWAQKQVEMGGTNYSSSVAKV